MRRGVSIDDVLVDTFLTSWLTSKIDIKRSTPPGYRIHIETHWLPHLGHLRLAELVKLPSGKRPKALVWTDSRVAHWRAAVTA